MKSVLSEIRKQTLTLIVAALGFVAALIWKDAITAWLKPLYESSEGPIGLTMAAFGVTIVVVVITIILTRFLGEKEKIN